MYPKLVEWLGYYGEVRIATQTCFASLGTYSWKGKKTKTVSPIILTLKQFGKAALILRNSDHQLTDFSSGQNNYIHFQTYISYFSRAYSTLNSAENLLIVSFYLNKTSLGYVMLCSIRLSKELTSVVIIFKGSIW